MDRKRELKELYKTMKPDMGVFILKSNFHNKCYIEGTQNLKGKINRTTFQLMGNCHPNKELQKEWNEHGEKCFTIQILENLKYDEDESKTDYSEELAILEMVWEEKLAKEGMEFY